MKGVVLFRRTGDRFPFAGPTNTNEKPRSDVRDWGGLYKDWGPCQPEAGYGRQAIEIDVLIDRVNGRLPTYKPPTKPLQCLYIAGKIPDAPARLTMIPESHRHIVAQYRGFRSRQVAPGIVAIGMGVAGQVGHEAEEAVALQGLDRVQRRIGGMEAFRL